MKEVSLTQNKTSLVDDEDYELVSKYKWCASKDHNRDKYYAKSRNKEGDWHKSVLMHRLIIDVSPEQQVDHINGNGLDNRKENLRICNSSENQQNSSCARGKSKYKGVTWNKNENLWLVRIMYKGKRLFLGYYKNEIEAAKIYDKAALKYFGEFANINLKGNENE